MSVYVDDMRRRARVGRTTARWSHLMADTHDELMQAALDLGLRPEWIQHEGTHREHFDVTESVRQVAIAQGVVPISYPRMTGELLNQKRAALVDPAREAGGSWCDWCGCWNGHAHPDCEGAEREAGGR